MLALDKAKLESSDKGFHVKGDLTFSSVSGLIENGREQIAQISVEAIQIDLNSVERIDSAGIALLLSWKRDCLLQNKGCEFQGVSAQANSLIETYRLQSVLS